MPQPLRWLCILPVLAALVPVQSTASTSTNVSFSGAMQQASQTRQVPLPLIEATTYVNTRWEWIGTPSIGGGEGPMNVLPDQMALAASLSGYTQAQISGDLASNLDAGAALLAHAHTSGTDLASWLNATSAVQGPRVTSEIYDVLRSGATRMTSTGETITLAPQALPGPSPTPSKQAPAAPNGGSSAAPSTSTTTTTDYPGATWVPADPSNYTVANRPHDYPVNMIVIHDIEGSDADAIQLFQTPGFAASAHYVVGYGGNITQMVREKDIAWHAGNWDYNTRAIGIEHAGFAGQNLYTTAEYDASAHLAAWICEQWGVPMDRNHVIGHYQVPDPNNPGLYGGSDHHTDPGPYWDWTYYMAQAQADANALPSPPHMMVTPTVITHDGGATVSWQAQTCHLPIADFKVTVQPGNIVIDAGTATSTNITGLTNGTSYTVTVTATNADGTDSNSAPLIPSPPCTSPTLTAVPASGATGTTVNFTGTASACTNPNYQFWIQPPGGAWSVAQDYSTSNTFAWSGSPAPGSYRFEVDTRQQTSAVVYDAVHDVTYAVNPCSAAQVSGSPASPEPPGTPVTLTGTATCPGTPEYRFWIRPPGGAWSIVQNYSPANTYAWSTTGQAMGTYSLEVDVRDHGADASYEAVGNSTFVLGPQVCRTAGLSASPTSPGPTGAPVTFTGSSTGCPNPLYRFWIRPPGESWTVLQDFSSTNTFPWTSTGTPGAYGVEVDAKDAGSSASYDAVSNVTYTLAGCAAANFTSDKPSPQLTGTASVTLTATSTCPGTPDYRFWIKAPGGAWAVVQNYSPTATLTWNTSALPAGAYSLEVDVRNHGSTASYEAVHNSTFTLSGCINASLTFDKASPQPAGTTMVLTGSASCTGTPQYRFWVRAPGGAWTIVRDYGAGTTFSWTPPTAGTYSLEVDVRNPASSASYEAVANQTYLVN
jgi:hypothetical protein